MLRLAGRRETSRAFVPQSCASRELDPPVQSRHLPCSNLLVSSCRDAWPTHDPCQNAQTQPMFETSRPLLLHEWPEHKLSPKAA